MDKTRVILDTNFLMLPSQYKVDVFEEISRMLPEPHEMCIFNETKIELEKLADAKKKDAVHAKVALELIKRKNLKTLKNSSKEISHVDDIILGNAAESDIVCSQDKALNRLLRHRFPRIRIITLNRKLIMR